MASIHPSKRSLPTLAGVLAAAGISAMWSCASITGLDDLQKADCVKDCAGSGGANPDGSAGNSGQGGDVADAAADAVYQMACVSGQQCSIYEWCCGRHTVGTNQYSSECYVAQVCALERGIRLCHPEADDCDGGVCTELPTFPGYPQCL